MPPLPTGSEHFLIPKLNPLLHDLGVIRRLMANRVYNFRTRWPCSPWVRRCGRLETQSHAWKGPKPAKGPNTNGQIRRSEEFLFLGILVSALYVAALHGASAQADKNKKTGR